MTADSNTNADTDSGNASVELVTLVVDQERCIGSGSCEMLEEEVFMLDDDTNIAGLVGDGQLPAARALAVIDRCPSAAIRIVEAADDSAPK